MADGSPLLVTGAAGFIGSHLARALVARGRRVVGVDNFDPFYPREVKEANLAGLDAAAFELHELDVRDADALRALLRRCRPAAVLHLAALAGVRPSLEEPARFVSVNVDGLASVLEAMRSAGCGRLLFASSSSVYGESERVPFSEDDDVSRPISPYAATKRAGELLCHTWCHLFGFATAAIRFFTVFGPGQRPDLAIASFMGRIAAGEDVPRFGSGDTSRDYTYIDDAVEGVLAALDRIAAADEGFFRIYNVGGARPVALSDLIEMIGEVVGRPPRILAMPEQPGDVTRTFADLRRSRAELGYAPRTGLREGLERQWAWMREHAAAR